AQAVALYATTGGVYILQYLNGHDRIVTDATGAVWHTANIFETTAIVSLFTMIFIAALVAIKLAQQQTASASEGSSGMKGAAEAVIAEHIS
ncbi:MAG: hypothetical protein ACM3N4_11135, partial [Nitrososphaerota archaeon]